MAELGLIVTLAAGFAAALVFGYVTQRLGLSPILGYLLAGIVVGPFTPGLVVDSHVAGQLAEVGVILLMFGVGLHLHLKDLVAVRKISIPGAVVQSATSTLLGALTARAFGLDWAAGLVLGLALAVASTVVLMWVLSENNAVQSPEGHVVVGWLIAEDILTVLVLVLLPVAASARGGSSAGLPAILGSVGLAVLKIGVLGLLVLLAGSKLIPRMLTLVARTRSRELFTLSVLAVALVIATLSSYVFGASMALGAFLAGIVVGQSKVSEQAAVGLAEMLLRSEGAGDARIAEEARRIREEFSG
jgi:CPA2 family monovalent cation:H+ antiporter-2